MEHGCCQGGGEGLWKFGFPTGLVGSSPWSRYPRWHWTTKRALCRGLLAEHIKSLVALPASGGEPHVAQGELTMGQYCVLSTPRLGAPRRGFGRSHCQVHM